MIILSLNVRGLNTPNKLEAVKEVTRQYKIDIIALQETRVKQGKFLKVSNIFGARL